MEVIILLFVIIASLTIGLFVINSNPKSITNRLFLVLNLAIVFWSISNEASLIATNVESALLWTRLTTFFAVPQATSLFLLVQNIPDTKKLMKKSQLIIVALITACTMILTLSPLMFKSVAISKNGNIPVVGSGIILFGLVVTVFSAMAVFILVKRYFKSNGLVKVQLGYVLLGMALMLVLIIGTIVFPVVFYNNITFVPFSPVYALLFLFFAAYAIIKHRLLDIRFIIVRSLAFLLLLLFIALGYIAILFNIAFFFNREEPSLQTLQGLIVPSILALFFAITFQPLRRVFEKFTNRIFYRDQYDSNELLWSLSRIMASTLLLSELTHQILDKLIGSVKVNYGSIVLVKDKTLSGVDSVGDVSHHPFKPHDIFTLVYDSYHSTRHNEHIFIFEELSEGKIKKLMREQDLTIVVPLTVRKELIGGLLLGQKSSGEIYSTEDIDVLKIIAPEIAVAVKNSLSYDEIKKFNITLENEVHRATSRLRRANNRLKELDQLKDEFVSIASHELRTPMTAIKSYLWMALNQPNQKIKEPLKKYLDISYNSTERLIRLVNDMLTVSRIERNKIELKKELINIIDVVTLVFEELKITADEKHIRFTFEHPKTALMINGDREKLREVIQNIIGNALKFTPEKGSITIVASVQGKTVQVAVTDTASGIPKDSISKLFQKFSKIEYSYSKHSSQPGTGLGLYISKQIASLHAGDIAVESEVGVGSTFTVILPLYTSSKGGEQS
ncbi:hypothetical protein KBD81_01700 [Candidatus Woesebacteria bacterium]|nr:hypothetical protein [Candidatus Woesebacteria bacterium]